MILLYPMNDLLSTGGNMKKAMKIIWIIIAVIIAVLIIGILLLKVLTSIPVVRRGYYKNAVVSGEVERVYTGLGDYETAFAEFKCDEEAFKEYRIWYPKELEKSNDTYPAVVMANGTGVPSKKYEPVFEHLASWGFIVIGNNDNESWSGLSSSKCLDFLIAENEREESLFFNKIDIKHIGIAGHSQGGVAAINAVTEFDNSGGFSSRYTASATWIDLAVGLKWNYDVKKVSIPYFFVAGTGQADSETISPLNAMNKAFDDISGQFTVMARRKNTDHGEMLVNADGYMTAWFCYTLKDDVKAAKVFTGENPEIETNTQNWQDVRIKDN